MARQAIFFIKENRYSPKTNQKGHFCVSNLVSAKWKLYLEQLNTELSHEQKKGKLHKNIIHTFFMHRTHTIITRGLSESPVV